MAREYYHEGATITEPWSQVLEGLCSCQEESCSCMGSLLIGADWFPARGLLLETWVGGVADCWPATTIPPQEDPRPSQSMADTAPVPALPISPLADSMQFIFHWNKQHSTAAKVSPISYIRFLQIYVFYCTCWLKKSKWSAVNSRCCLSLKCFVESEICGDIVYKSYTPKNYARRNPRLNIDKFSKPPHAATNVFCVN